MTKIISKLVKYAMIITAMALAIGIADFFVKIKDNDCTDPFSQVTLTVLATTLQKLSLRNIINFVQDGISGVADIFESVVDCF